MIVIVVQPHSTCIRLHDEEIILEEESCEQSARKQKKIPPTKYTSPAPTPLITFWDFFKRIFFWHSWYYYQDLTTKKFKTYQIFPSA